MKLIMFKDVAINIDRIDAVCRDTHDSERTHIYVGGSDNTFVVNKPLEEVINIICNYL